jgi:hypothetical protein
MEKVVMIYARNLRLDCLKREKTKFAGRKKNGK